MKKTSFAILTLTAATSMTFAADATAPKKTATAPKKAATAPKVIKATVPVAPKVNFDFLPEVVAEVNGKKLTKAELIKKLLGPMGGKMPQGIKQDMLVRIAKSMAERFIQSTALLDAAVKAGFKPSPEFAAKEFNKFLKNASPLQVAQIKRELAKQNLTIEKFIATKKNDKEFQKQMAINSFFEKNVLSKCVVTDKEAKEYYDANPNAFKTPGDPKDSMRAAHILIMAKEKTDAKTKAAAKAKAEKLLAMLKKDASLFGELAEKESECPSGKSAKGSLGAFQKGQMVPAFEKAVVNLKDGEISGIVETQYGYHIIRRDALQGAKTKTFAEVKDKLKNFLKQQKVQKASKPFVDKIVAEAKGKNYIK
jgi:parvulin-like peptidyl-prolyl isomerase